MSIDTLDAVKLMLGVTGTADDDLLNALRAAADEYIPRYCGRGFCGGTFTEDHAGGGRMLFLGNYPVSSVASVKVDLQRAFGSETALDASRYYVHVERGVVECLDGPFVPSLACRCARPSDFPGAVRVAYTVATGAVPEAVCRAYAELIGHWYRQAKTAVALGQKNVVTTCNEDGTMQTTYPWGQSGGFKVPDGVIALLAPYRVPAM